MEAATAYPEEWVDTANMVILAQEAAVTVAVLKVG